MVIIAGVYSCNNDPKSVVSNVDSSDIETNRHLPDSNSATYRKDKLGKIFNHAKPFEILTFKKGVTLEYTGPDDTTECRYWTIEKHKIHAIIKNSVPISGTIWDLAFVFTTCIVTGQIKQDEDIFEYSINAGSWFRVTCRDTSLLYGNFNNVDRTFFLYDADTN